VFNALAYVHAQLFRLCLWLLKLPLKAIWGTLQAMLSLLGQEVRRWLGVAVAGLLILGAGKATMSFAPVELKRPLALTVLVLVAIWALAVRRAAHHTMHNNLYRVRQLRWNKELRGEVSDMGKRVTEGMAKATRGTPLDRLFDRDHRAKVEADARAAEAHAAAERRAAAEEAAHWSPEQVAERRTEAAAEPAAVVSKGGYRVA
jgi:hypothetical protein